MGAAFSIKPHKSKKDLVYETLKESITNGKWEPGEKRNANEIGKKLGVSRTPVIEACKALEIEGLLRILPQVGIEVPQMTIEEVEEIFYIRGALEGLAAQRACRHMNNKDFEKLEEFFKTCNGHIKTESFRQYARVNKEFHLFICRCSNMPQLINLLERYWHSKRYSWLLFSYMPEILISLEEDHRQIINSLKNREEEKARSRAEKHSHHFMAALVNFLRGTKHSEENSTSSPRIS